MQTKRTRHQGIRSKIVGVLLSGWKGIVGIVVLLAAVAQIYFSTWRMSVSPGETLKASDPLATMFVLHNEGQFAVHDIKFLCFLNRISYLDGTIVEYSMGNNAEFNVLRLDGNGKTSTPCYVPVKAQPVSADVTIIVSYRPSFYPFEKHQNFRFVAQWKDEGGFVWVPMGG
ncbi:MAG TPA: hypothetical protein VJP89_19755 [Pyrinomonadaceae bacterium]|nr:hypothetical protein [Pyrinomonadaceae bacterium]